MSTTVVIGTDKGWDYTIPTPIAALLWRELVGFGSFVALIGNESEWSADPVARLCLEALRHHEIAHEFVACPPGFLTSNAAQSVRQHVAASLRFADDEWIMPLDADMWTMQRDYFRQHESRDELVVSYFADGDCWRGKEYFLDCWDRNVPSQSIPTAYFTMRAKTWRDCYQYPSTSIGDSLHHTFETVLRPRLSGTGPHWSAAGIAWYFDQYYMTERACRQDWFPSRALLINRHANHRGHQAAWDVGGWDYGNREIDWSWCDVHFRKGMYAERRWEGVFPIVERLIPQHAAWARDYLEAAHAEWERVEGKR